MAYIANTAFEVKISNHEFDSIANITGYFMNSSTPEICSAGFLCTRDELTDNEGYTNVGPSGSQITLTNTNTWNMVAATSSDLAQTGIYACNPFDVNMITDPVTGAVYKVGSNTLGLPAPAGYPTTFTKIHFNNDNVYRFGVGNMSTTVSTNKFFTINNGLLVPAASAPSTTNGQPYFELVGTGTFTQGAYAGFTYYDVRACTAVVTGGAAG